MQMDQLEARLGEVAGLLRAVSSSQERIEGRQHDMAQQSARQSERLDALGIAVDKIEARIARLEVLEHRVLALERVGDRINSRAWEFAKEGFKLGAAAAAGWIAGMLGGGKGP